MMYIWEVMNGTNYVGHRIVQNSVSIYLTDMT